MDLNKIIDELENLVYISKKCENLFLNEENTKAALIIPFLKMLGYDMIIDIEPEYRICSGRVDYFIHKRNKSIVVECKRVNTDLDRSEHVEQLKTYMRELEPTIGILTNGRIYNFYKFENKRIDLVFTFNILHSNISDLKHLLKYSKDRIDLIDSEYRTREDMMMAIQSKGISVEDILRALEDRILNDIFANGDLDLDIKSKDLSKLLEEKLGLSVRRSEAVIRARKAAIGRLTTGTAYQIMPHVYRGNGFKIASNSFTYSFGYCDGLAYIDAGTKISDRCTYKGNEILEAKIKGSIVDWKLKDKVDGILLRDAINIIFGVSDGIIPENIVNAVRRDSYNSEHQYVFNAICNIVNTEKVVCKTVEILNNLLNKSE